MDVHQATGNIATALWGTERKAEATADLPTDFKFLGLAAKEGDEAAIDTLLNLAVTTRIDAKSVPARKAELARLATRSLLRAYADTTMSAETRGSIRNKIYDLQHGRPAAVILSTGLLYMADRTASVRNDRGSLDATRRELFWRVNPGSHFDRRSADELASPARLIPDEELGRLDACSDALEIWPDALSLNDVEPFKDAVTRMVDKARSDSTLQAALVHTGHNHWVSLIVCPPSNARLGFLVFDSDRRLEEAPETVSGAFRTPLESLMQVDDARFDYACVRARMQELDAPNGCAPLSLRTLREVGAAVQSGTPGTFASVLDFLGAREAEWSDLEASTRKEIVGALRAELISGPQKREPVMS
ncbi:hypothetical protein WG922_06735 [Ramlibacter sp. AN1015]|uniref:hypothetical protein n=1 Tax=Ramlibacter sp. AN1015 TaxID=3133428 RepID=UPI0030BD7BA0